MSIKSKHLFCLKAEKIWTNKHFKNNFISKTKKVRMAKKGIDGRKPYHPFMNCAKMEKNK